MFLLITKKKWEKKNFNNLSKYKIIVKNNFKINEIKKINPRIIFFLHWSKYIPEKVYNKYLCIQFHISDLPFGRGGSPVQNQILKNITETKISALKVSEKIDAGPICLKSKISLLGRAQDIFIRMEKISIQMTKKIVQMKKINFRKQKGRVFNFKRRDAYQSKLLNSRNELTSIKKLHNFIRALDAEGYPKANFELNKFKILLSESKMYKKHIVGKFRIEKKK